MSQVEAIKKAYAAKAEARASYTLPLGNRQRAYALRKLAKDECVCILVRGIAVPAQ